MATLQKPKPKTSRTPRQEATTEDTIRPNDERTTTFTLAGDTNELEQLMLEPVSYDQLCTTTTTISKQDGELSPELVQSLQSVKQVCLVALDSFLRQIVNTIPSTKAERRLSDSSVHEQSGHYSLLNSIVQSTNRLSSTPSSQHHQMKRSDSTPAVATLSIVQQVLTSHQTWLLDSSTDYNMCCSLAALLHHLYRILELGQSSKTSSSTNNEDDDTTASPTSPISPTSSIYSQLRESMSTFQKEKANGSKTIHTIKSQQQQLEDDEMTILWDELDQLMNSITCLAQERPVIESAPPAYYDIVTSSLDTSSSGATLTLDGKSSEKKDVTPPGYPLHHQNEKAAYELDQLLSAIDQLSSVSPRLNNQRVDMTERQANELAAATVGRTIERLSRGRLEKQRASLSTTDFVTTKHDMLQGLMNQIQRSSLRSLDNQRVSMNNRLKKKMNVATINGILDQNDRGRLASQDWTSPEQQMIDDMTTMTDMLTKVMNRPKYSQQRYSLSALKEREFFFNHLLQKVDRMEGRRMSNQDAEWTHTNNKAPQQSTKSDMEDELTYLFDNIHRSKSQLDNQRATFSTSPLILSTAST